MELFERLVSERATDWRILYKLADTDSQMPFSSD